MPKVMVLFLGDDRTVAVADAVVAGAKSVRFTEVESRTLTAAEKYKLLDPAEPLGETDGIVLVSAGVGDSASLEKIVHGLSHNAHVRDLVVGVVGEASMVSRVSSTGAIVIGQRSGSETTDEARALGQRVAKVAGWVRHGLGHEAEHHHHDHAADHHHGHDGHSHGHEHHH